MRVRRPAAGRRDRDTFISGKNGQNAVKTMVLTDQSGRLLFCSPARPGSCADIIRAHQLGLIKLLADGPAVELLADAGYQGLGAQTGGRVVTPPQRTFKKNAPDWYEEIHTTAQGTFPTTDPRRARGRVVHRGRSQSAGCPKPPSRLTEDVEPPADGWAAGAGRVG
ncbi:transposase family protein [Streptomyces sp. NPDC059982]|uniref:transposase family protein n=1 Tax=unclassified Streptomyces TaxID=2593676 RepID=UPI0036A22665